MLNQSRDKLERIAKIRRIKNYEVMSKEELIMSLLKSKISDIRGILNRLRDILPKRYRKEIKKKLYEQKIMKIFQKQKEKKMMNILENQ